MGGRCSAPPSHLGCETTRCRRPAMRLPSECYQMQKTIETHLPHLSQPQSGPGLARWVCGAQRPARLPNAVASALSPWSNWYNLRPAPQGPTTAGPRDSLPDRAGRNSVLRWPLLRWVLCWWRSGGLALAIGPPSKATRPPPSSSALYRRPSPWPGYGADRPGSWMDPTVELLHALAPAVPGI